MNVPVSAVPFWHVVFAAEAEAMSGRRFCKKKNEKKLSQNAMFTVCRLCRQRENSSDTELKLNPSRPYGLESDITNPVPTGILKVQVGLRTVTGDATPTTTTITSKWSGSLAA